MSDRALLELGTEEDDADSRSESDDNHEDSVYTLALRLVLSIVIPMWIAMILSSLFFVGVRQLLGKLGPESDMASRELSIHISANNSFPPVMAVPALFGYN